MMLTLYRSLTTLGAPLIAFYLSRRMAQGREDAARFGERRGLASRPRPEGRLVWLHAASVGEAVSMLPVVDRLLAAPGISVLVTTGTVTSARLMAARLPDGAFHQYVPVDRLPWVRRFLDHWRPDLALWTESEFWPNLLIESAKRHVPMILLNGRISDRSFARWRRHPRLIRRLLGCFSLCLAQTAEDAQRFAALGAQPVACHGNLKFAAPPLPADQVALDSLERAAAGRPRWLAASTHAGEEALAGRIHRQLAAGHPGLLSVIVPRHPNRGQAIAEELAAMGLKVARRSQGQAPGPDTDILLADTLGELGLFVRLAPLVFMGKSLCGAGGQNPLEPARLGAAVLYGPHMDNFLEIAGRMARLGAARQVADEAELAAALDERLADPARVAEEGGRARAFASGEARVLDDVMAALQAWLTTREKADARA